jgi:hypothetical protein
MLKQISIVMLLAMLVLATGCSKRRTRQFVVPDVKVEGYKAGDWLISKPAVIAFKDVIDLKDISDTTMFWISMRAKTPRESESDAAPDLVIDSIKVSFIPDGGEYWRKPTRSAPYGTPEDKFARKAFDFFGDQGIVIPAQIDSILVEFDAFALDGQGQIITVAPIAIRMVREEKQLSVPLLQE